MIDASWAQVLVGAGSVALSAAFIVWRAGYLVAELKRLRLSVDRLYEKLDGHDARLRAVEQTASRHDAVLGAQAH